MDKITPCLWFDPTRPRRPRGSTPRSSRTAASTEIDRSPAETPSGPEGSVLTVDFTLGGRPFMALNGGPDFPFTEAISMSIDCEDQAEVDRYWDALLSDGGEESVCGWLKDRFGLSWQVVPHRWRRCSRAPTGTPLGAPWRRCSRW